MRVRMKVALSGSYNGEPWPRVGETADLPDDEAAHLLTAGLVTATDESEQPAKEETATAPAAETATPKPRKAAAKKN